MNEERPLLRSSGASPRLATTGRTVPECNRVPATSRARVKTSVGLPTHRVDRPEEFLTAAAVGELAATAEAAGFDAVYVTEHPFPGDGWLASGGHHALDPMVALS